jgi:predicted nucleotidyltransferase
MARGPSPNRELLVSIAKRLGSLREELVFVGGQVAELLVASGGAVRARPTDDVDVVVHATTRTAYHRFGERLRAVGFREDSRPRAPICRWVSPDGEMLDVLPVQPALIGFSNSWYEIAFASASPIEIAPGLVIRIPSAAAFLASKCAAFADRGRADVLGSHDLEDLVALVAGRPSVLDELRAAPPEVAAHVAGVFADFLRDPRADDAIGGALPDAWVDPHFIAAVRERFEAIAAL